MAFDCSVVFTATKEYTVMVEPPFVNCAKKDTTEVTVEKKDPTEIGITPSLAFANGSPVMLVVDPVPMVVTTITPRIKTNLPTLVYVPLCVEYVVVPPNDGVQVPSS